MASFFHFVESIKIAFVVFREHRGMARKNIYLENTEKTNR